MSLFANVYWWVLKSILVQIWRSFGWRAENQILFLKQTNKQIMTVSFAQYFSLHCLATAFCASVLSGRGKTTLKYGLVIYYYFLNGQSMNCSYPKHNDLTSKLPGLIILIQVWQKTL